MQRAAGAQHIRQTLLAKTEDTHDGKSMRVLDRLKLNRTPLVGNSNKSVKPGASPLQRVNQPGQVPKMIHSVGCQYSHLLNQPALVVQRSK